MGNLKTELLKFKNTFFEKTKGVLLEDQTPLQKMRGAKPPSIEKMKEFSERHSLSSLLPYESYDEKKRLYYNQDTVGFMLISSPACKLSIKDISVLNSIFSEDNRTNSSIQISLLSDPNIDQLLDNWSDNKMNARNKKNEDIFKLFTENQKKYFKSGRWTSLFPIESQLAMNLKLIISFTIPLNKELGISIESIDFLIRKRDNFKSILKSVGIYANELGPSSFINILNSILNPLDNRQPDLEYDENNFISGQIVDQDTSYLIGASSISITHAEKNFSMIPLHAKQFPKRWKAYLNGDLIGHFLKETKRISCPYIITLTVNIPDQTSVNSKIKGNLTRATQMQGTPIGRFVPQWEDRKEDWGFVSKKVEDGNRLLEASFQTILMCKEGEESRVTQGLKDLYKDNDWILSNSRYIALHSLLSSLPMGITQQIKSDLKRFGHYSSKLSWNCTNLAPWIGEWKGTKTPMMMFLGRRGQICFFNPFDNTQGNFNLAVCATSGAGKSFLAQGWIFCVLGGGGRVFVIDSGGSYENLCKLLGGTYIDFAKETPKLNPFSKIFGPESIRRVKELEKIKGEYSIKDYLDDFMPMLIDLASQMASPEFPLDEIKKTFIERAITDSTNKYQEKTTITNVVKSLDELSKEEMGHHAKEVALMLFSYTKEGMYGKYFEGESNIDFNNDFVVLELGSLNDKVNLRAIVLQILIIEINQVMYVSGDRSQMKQVIIDEAWKLLVKGRSGSFIEEGYRVARKHGGSYMTITQGISDYYKSEIAKAAIMNSDYTIFLRQKDEALNKAVEHNHIDNSDGKVDIIESLKTEKGYYSEAAILTPSGIGVVRFCIDRVSEKIFSTKAEEVDFIRNAQKEGKTLLEAVDELIKVSS